MAKGQGWDRPAHYPPASDLALPESQFLPFGPKGVLLYTRGGADSRNEARVLLAVWHGPDTDGDRFQVVLVTVKRSRTSLADFFDDEWD